MSSLRPRAGGSPDELAAPVTEGQIMRLQLRDDCSNVLAGLLYVVGASRDDNVGDLTLNPDDEAVQEQGWQALNASEGWVLFDLDPEQPHHMRTLAHLVKRLKLHTTFTGDPETKAGQREALRLLAEFWKRYGNECEAWEKYIEMERRRANRKNDNITFGRNDSNAGQQVLQTPPGTGAGKTVTPLRRSSRSSDKMYEKKKKGFTTTLRQSTANLVTKAKPTSFMEKLKKMKEARNAKTIRHKKSLAIPTPVARAPQDVYMTGANAQPGIASGGEQQDHVYDKAEKPTRPRYEDMEVERMDHEEDPAFTNRADNAQRIASYDTAYGRFVLRRPQDMTIADRAFLRNGNNDLITLAEEWCNMSEEGFLLAIFEGDWNTAVGPTSKPAKGERIASDSGIPCGIFTRDCYNKAERKKMEITGKSPEELGYKPLPERKKGKTVFLKVTPAMMRPRIDFVCSKQRWVSDEDITLVGGKYYGDYVMTALANYDEKDAMACHKTNKATLVWLARLRLHTWYTHQEPRHWAEDVIHYNLVREESFSPMQPLRTSRQNFGSGLATDLRIAGGLALTPTSDTPNGVRRDGSRVQVMNMEVVDVTQREEDRVAVIIENRPGRAMVYKEVMQEETDDEDSDYREDSAEFSE